MAKTHTDRKIYLRCLDCGSEKASNFFYTTRGEGSLFSNVGFILVCKDCMTKTFLEYYKEVQNYKYALYLTLRKYDIKYDETQALKLSRDSQVKEDRTKMVSRYMSWLNRRKCDNYGFDASDKIDGHDTITIHNGKEMEQILKEQIEEIEEKYKDYVPADQVVTVEKEEEVDDYLEQLNTMQVELTEREAKDRASVLKQIGYDPFEYYPEYDRKYLYSDLLKGLDDGILGDSFKLNQLMQVVTNNIQLRKINFVTNNLMRNLKNIESKSKTIKEFSEIKAKLSSDNNNILDKSGLSTKNSQVSATLTGMMQEMRAADLREIEEDFYDILSGKGIQHVAEVSSRALMATLDIDTEEVKDMLKEQGEIITGMQKNLREKDEEIKSLVREIQAMREGS